MFNAPDFSGPATIEISAAQQENASTEGMQILREVCRWPGGWV